MGLVLVFDMDQTLIDSSTGFKNISDENLITEIKIAMNMDMINKVLKSAAHQRERGKVDAIVMLTNNSDKIFAAWISMLIAEILNSRSKYEPMYVNPELDVVYTDSKPRKSLDSFFDYIMWRGHSSRPDIEDTPKRIQDVKYMMEKLTLSTENLEQRTYFFDDRTDHLIGADFDRFGLGEHYIVIKSNRPELAEGFSKGAPDIPDYTPILKALVKRGGARKTRKSRKLGKTKH
jgi:hypothetical protein